MHSSLPESNSSATSYQTLLPHNLTNQHDANDIQTDLRNMLPNSKLFYVPSQSALSIRGSAEEYLARQKIVSDLDRNKKIYRLTYTITDIDNGKRAAPQHVSIIVASGSKMDFKTGKQSADCHRIVHGDGPGSSNSQVQYQDVGLEIEASLNAYLDGVRLQTKTGGSSVAEEKSGVGAQDPIFRQTTFEGTSTSRLESARSRIDGSPWRHTPSGSRGRRRSSSLGKRGMLRSAGSSLAPSKPAIDPDRLNSALPLCNIPFAA